MLQSIGEQKKPSRRSLLALDFLNFFLANVRSGVGPFLATYLLAYLHWNPADIGVAMSIMGMATLLAQTPCGALVDSVKGKRRLIVIATTSMSLCCVAITIFPNSFVNAAQVINGVSAAIFPPAIAAITLGMVGQERLAIRVGRNQVFNHMGRVMSAVSVGAIGYFMGQEWIFYSVAISGAASIASTLFIRRDDIDYLQARATKPVVTEDRPIASGIRAVLTDSKILIFAVAVTLFHFANAAMLPLAGQLIARTDKTFASVGMAACIISSQMVMAPVAFLSGRSANQWGRKPVFLIGFAALTFRGFLYTLSDNPFFIVSVQLLDGIGQGIFGVLSVTVVADLTQGSGRYNLVLGAIGTAKSIGAALSNVVAGHVAHVWGFNAGFLFLGVIAASGLMVYYLFVPETKSSNDSQSLSNHTHGSFWG